MVRIRNGKPQGEMDVKRFYLPGVVLTDKCHGCEASVKFDFGEKYLSYPEMNMPEEHTLYCESCDTEWNVLLELVVKLKAVKQ